MDANRSGADLLTFDLDDDERLVLRCGLVEWGGPSNCTDELAVAMGFASVQDLFANAGRLVAAVEAGAPLSRTDWFRVVLATEIVFASDLVGSGTDWRSTTGLGDEDTIRVLRRIQRKVTGELRGVVGGGVGTRADVDGVSPDGSPVSVYLALPAEPDLGRVRSVMSEGCSVLDLGAGVGRLSNPLAALGHRVVAVDNSMAMLDHVRGAVAILADIWSLDAGERFDVVLALSHLINDPSRERRLQLLAICRRHLRDHGRVIVQRHAPAWVPTEGRGAVGEVAIRLHDLVDEGESFSAATTYTVQGRSWTQRWRAAIVDDAELSTLAELAGLSVEGTLDEAGAWVLLRRR